MNESGRCARAPVGRCTTPTRQTAGDLLVQGSPAATDLTLSFQQVAPSNRASLPVTYRTLPAAPRQAVMRECGRSVAPMLLAPWIIGKPAGETFELLFVFVTTVLGIVLLYLFGRYWQQ